MLKEYYVLLQKVLGFGSAKLSAVLKAFETPQILFESDAARIQESGIFSEEEIKKINKIPLDYASNILENCEKNGCFVITPDMDEYPKRLFNTIDPPCVLYVKGKFPEFDNEAVVSIVGSRHPTEDGIKAAASLSARLARAGMVIVSGGAYGIDRAAHGGTLAVNGVTACVMPCGIDVNYPAGNREMRENIQKDGCLISEFPPETGVTTGAFHIRNRIVSALSLGTVVIEAGERSGTLITAHKAIDQGRDVFVVPGSLGIKQYAGSNQLIHDGARPLLNAGDILGEYASAYPHKLSVRTAFEPFSADTLRELSFLFSKPNFMGKSKIKQQNVHEHIKDTKKLKEQKQSVVQKKEIPKGEVSEEAITVYNTFENHPMSVDLLISRSGLDGNVILACLTELELFGYIKSLPGGRYEMAEE